jgi:hypothetical protein
VVFALDGLKVHQIEGSTESYVINRRQQKENKENSHVPFKDASNS